MYLITAVVVPVVMVIIMWTLYRLSYRYHNIIGAVYVVHVGVFMLSFIFLLFHIYRLSIGMMDWWWLLIGYLLYNIAPVLDIPMEPTRHYVTDGFWDPGCRDPRGWLYVGLYTIIAPLIWYFNATEYLRDKVAMKKKQVEGVNG